MKKMFLSLRGMTLRRRFASETIQQRFTHQQGKKKHEIDRVESK
jgi:hypothetical protein